MKCKWPRECTRPRVRGTLSVLMDSLPGLSPSHNLFSNEAVARKLASEIRGSTRSQSRASSKANFMRIVDRQTRISWLWWLAVTALWLGGCGSYGGGGGGGESAPATPTALTATA